MSAATAVPAHRRHDISGQVWEILEPLLPGGKGKTGRPAYDNRLFLNAVFWILRTGAPWRDLPPDYGDWKNTHRPPPGQAGGLKASAAGGTGAYGPSCWTP